MYDVADYGLLGARVCLSAVFLYSGIDKLAHWREGVVEVSALRLPQPALFLGLTIVVQLGAGLMVLLGFYARVGALLLFGFTGLATLLAHRFWQDDGPERRRNLTTALEHLAIMGGFLLILALGAGNIALDRPDGP